MYKKFKQRSVATVALVVLLLANFTGPASAGYLEGRISCQSNWKVMTRSYSGVDTRHEHYLEPNSTVFADGNMVVLFWIGARNYGTWSVEAAPLYSGGGGCIQR